MCAAAVGWFNRYVTCCVTTSSSSTTLRDVRDDNVARLGSKDCYCCCSSARLQRGSDGANSFGSRCRRRSEHEQVSKVVKPGDDEDNSDQTTRFPVMTTDLEYVCCCDRCDSVMGWYLTTVPADAAAEQSWHKIASSLRLQNYMVACDADRARTTYGACRGPLNSDSSCSAAGGEDTGMSVSLISSCDIKGVDLLAGHHLKKDNELIGCFRPPPNRTIGHIYLAAATQRDAAELCRLDKASTRCRSCCTCASNADDCPPTTCCGVFRKTRRRRQRSVHRMSTDKCDFPHLSKR